MELHDVEEMTRTGTQIVFAVDQRPFEVTSKYGSSNTFSLLVPLMTEDEEVFTPDRLTSLFPGRGRVWWMIRRDLPIDQIVPGSIWSGPIELSGNPDKDRYQIRRREVTQSARRMIEVLDLDYEPDVMELLSGPGLAVERPPLPRLLLRGRRTLVGPWKAIYHEGTGRVRLEAVHPGDPKVYQAERSQFDEAIHALRFMANTFDPGHEPLDVRLALMHERHLERLQNAGKVLDAASDTQVVAYMLGRLKVPRRDQQLFKEALSKVESAAGTEDAQFDSRMERFRRLCTNAARIAGLGFEAAEAAVSHDGFRELIRHHADRLAADRVEELVAERRAEVERRIVEENQKLERLRRELAELQDQFDERSRRQEQEFQEQNEARLRRLEEREQAVERHEKEIMARLHRVIEQYRVSGEAIGDQLIAHLPLLRRLGLGSSPAGEASHETLSRPLSLPVFLQQRRQPGKLSEAEFIDQLEDVVGRRGFQYEREDLIDFHVCVKIGYWTVLAGATGLGKSSLPRLYAEALGCSDEFLFISVRPDWLDDRDLTGAFNSLSMRYEPSASGLIDRLIAAREDERFGRGGIYLFCFDEMNLSRVEHYLAQFLSVLEHPAAQRALRLFARGLEREGDPYSAYRLLPLGDNIRFVGTVNIDETTHFFSPKVLDRMPIVPLARGGLQPGTEEPARSLTLGGLAEVHIEEFRSWIRPPLTSGSAVDRLLVLDEILCGSRQGLGYRARDRILAFVASGRELLGETKAFDLAMVHTVLPRLRRTAPHFERLMDELRRFAKPAEFARSATLLEAMADAGGEDDFFSLL